MPIYEVRWVDTLAGKGTARVSQVAVSTQAGVAEAIQHIARGVPTINKIEEKHG